MKRILVFFVLTFAVAFYAYFGVYLKNTKKNRQNFLLENPQNLVGFHLTTAQSEVKIKLEEGLWKVTQPHLYPADHGFVQSTFRLMAKAPILSTFPLEEDFFGLDPGKAFMEFIYNDGLRKRFVIAKEDGPKNSLYVLDKDSTQVFVVHGIFGQFLHYSLAMFFHKNLPILGKKIQSLELIQSNKTLWKILRTDSDQSQIHVEDKEYWIPKEKLLPFFERLKHFEIRNHRFGEFGDFKATVTLLIQTDKGSFAFDFNYETSQVYSKDHRVLAQFDPSSLKFLDSELKRVVKSKK